MVDGGLDGLRGGDDGVEGCMSGGELEFGGVLKLGVGERTGTKGRAMYFISCIESTYRARLDSDSALGDTCNGSCLRRLLASR